MALFQLLAHHGRLVLIAGLVAGVLLPGLALALKPWLPEMVALLLFLAAFRVGPSQVLGNIRQWPQSLTLIIIFQIAVPLSLLAVFSLAGFSGPLAFAIVLMASASSISGSANLTILTGNDAAPALRLLIIGTAFLPLTVLPVLWFVPEMGSAQSVLTAAARLLLIISVTTVAAFSLRHIFLPRPDTKTVQAIDGISALVMAIMVIGLMSAMGPALRDSPAILISTLAIACAANFGFQILAWLALGPLGFIRDRAGVSIVAGNRNMALFLAALPVSVTDPILLFIGCYQVPMYLTPIALGWLYRSDGPA